MADGRLTLLQLNDTHAYLEPHPEVFWEAGGSRVPDGGRVRPDCRAGRRARAETGGRALLLDCGDTLHGTAPAVKTRGAAMVPVLNSLGIAAMTAHWDFAYGPARLRELATRARLPRARAELLRPRERGPAVSAVDPDRDAGPHGRRRRHRRDHPGQGHAPVVRGGTPVHGRHGGAARRHRGPPGRGRRPGGRAQPPGPAAGRPPRLGGGRDRRPPLGPHPQPARGPDRGERGAPDPVGGPRLVRRPARPRGPRRPDRPARAPAHRDRRGFPGRPGRRRARR